MRWRRGRRTVIPALLAMSFASGGLGALASPAGAADTPSYAQLVAKVKQAATRPGQVLHTTGTVSTGGIDSTIESWIDLPNRTMRQQVVTAAPTATGTASLVTDGRFRVFSPAGDQLLSKGVCPVSGLTASLVELCGGNPASRPDRVDRTVVDARRGGRHAWKLTTTAASRNQSLTIHSTSRMWLDQRTGLPLAGDFDSRVTNEGATQRHRVEMEETSELVAADSVPGDFFSPASIAAWMKDHTPPTQQFGPPPRAALVELRSGIASNGARWSLSEDRQAAGCSYAFAIGNGSGYSGGSCPQRGARRDLPGMQSLVAGNPAFQIVVAPPGTETVEIVARRGTHGRESTILNSDPITGSNGSVYFVVELPEGAHNVRSVRVVG